MQSIASFASIFIFLFILKILRRNVLVLTYSNDNKFSLDVEFEGGFDIFLFCVVGLFFYKAHFICYVSSCMLTNVRLCVCVICRVISVKISLSRDITISCIHQISTTEMFSTLNSKISIVLEKGFFWYFKFI